MKHLILLLSGIILFGTVSAQSHEVLIADYHNLTDQSFDGKYSGFLHNEDNPYRIDENGLVSGKHLTFHEGGALEGSGMYLEGVKHGAWLKYDEAGKLISSAYFNNGQKDGPWKIWDEQGTLRFEMHYKNGNRVKTWKVYDSKGDLVESKDYGK